MKKIFVIVVVMMVLVSCNKQEPNTNAERREFYENIALSDEFKEELYRNPVYGIAVMDAYDGAFGTTFSTITLEEAEGREVDVTPEDFVTKQGSHFLINPVYRKMVDTFLEYLEER